MRLWRISNYADLNGLGGLRVPGRWHYKGYPVVYAADHPASAMVEMLVHFDSTVEELPVTFRLLEIEVPPAVSSQHVDPDTLPPEWTADADITRSIGTQWLRQRQSAVLRVPSAVVPAGWNYLINPTHGDSGDIAIISESDARWDRRLV